MLLSSRECSKNRREQVTFPVYGLCDALLSPELLLSLRLNRWCFRICVKLKSTSDPDLCTWRFTLDKLLLNDFLAEDLARFRTFAIL